MARSASPELAYRIGQEFKENKTLNQLDNGNRPEEQSPQHLLAHAILGAAVSYATGQDIGIGALSAAGSEAVTPILSDFLFGKKPNELSQEQKDTITSILNLTTVTTAYSTTGDVSSAVNAAEVGRVGVENNNSSRRIVVRNPVQQQRLDIINLETAAIRRYLPGFNGIPSLRPNSHISAVEVAEYQAFSRFLRYSNQTYPDAQSAYQAFRQVGYRTGLSQPIIGRGGYYYANNMKITQSYYNRLWREGRPAPFVQAREILSSNPRVERDPQGRPSFNRYTTNNLEMIYNPTTGEIWHIQPTRNSR
ncbi:VENN motif pre-toxin domain-containing protein [Moraxella cuniculi]|uniref:VENN motif pre-toxin domain-containing protein n=1 Tax=Moraxella cuniculi TaxID=34061 RepID=UPI001474920E|nr:VENN motif pre-toxin domain-containing protein [Moraxella cuniculi]